MTKQLELFSDSVSSGPFVCRGIFSSGYLNRHLRRHSAVPAAGEVKALYESLHSRWEKNRAGLAKQNEAYTRTQFLDAVLGGLGWESIPEKNLPGKGPLKKRPDYCLFGDAAARQQGADQPDTAATFRYAVSVLEAKKWGHPLDKISSSETPGWFPSQQIQDYLRHAKDATGSRLFNWAILTNGGAWRLYCENAPNDAFFEFTLADNDNFCSLDDFRLFVALFRPAAFLAEQGRCLLDDLRQEALTRQAKLEENLRRRIFDVLEELANAFRDHEPNHITKEQYPALYENALIFLYRLLFVLYAESRTLLPVKPHGAYGSSKLYREKFSLVCLTADLRDTSRFNDDAFTDVYERLLDLFHLINGSEPKKNEAAKVPRYNGGLFHPEAWPQIEEWRIGDAAMASVLRQLIFSQPPARKAAAQLRISTDEAIDYASLEVRQLGDIYEGLLGAHLAQNPRGRLELLNAKGENHRQGIYYTPDWIVRYLIRETISPLLRAAEQAPDVQAAIKARSDEKRRDNSFAHAVLRLNVVDPAMGSGHFLVRSVEWLGEQIVYHPTTKVMTEQIVHSGAGRRTRDEILKDGRIPVPPGVSQEEAEIAYWRRRVVEACIYGVDLNPLAVELAKLSLWLTCIAADEPLNFLDHHLRCGNSLIYVHPDEISIPPAASEFESAQGSFDLGPILSEALCSVIAQNVAIEESASTEMELVKRKEQRWRAVREKITPFLDTATLWLAAQDGLPVNPLDYLTLARHRIDPDSLEHAELRRAEKLRGSLAEALSGKTNALQPFHWHLEFADVFYEADGTPRPEKERGFDAVLGNPPYISVQTSSEANWRGALERRQGFLDDLYVHFTDMGFALLRPGGGLGFIVSDTFFTLASKLNMRQLLQAHTLTHLGQCDPFEATVDAAIFVARKGPPPQPEQPALFIQARPRRNLEGTITNPEPDLSSLPESPEFPQPDTNGTQHTEHGSLRLHRVSPALWRSAHKQAFFEPRPGTLRLFERFNDHVKALVEEWWSLIENSEKFGLNRDRIEKCFGSA